MLTITSNKPVVSMYLNKSHLTKNFIEQIKEKNVIDTKKYRYVYHNFYYGWSITRIPIHLLDTIAAIRGGLYDAWETVIWYENNKDLFN